MCLPYRSLEENIGLLNQVVDVDTVDEIQPEKVEQREKENSNVRES